MGDELPKMSRRVFTRDALLTAIASAIPGVAQAAPGYNQTPCSPEDIAFLQSIVEPNSQTLTQFRRNPTAEQCASMVRALARGDARWAEAIDRVPDLHAGARALYNKEGQFIGNGTVLRLRDERVEGGPPAYRYVLSTAGHVAVLSVAPGGKKWKYDKDGYDSACCEISEQEAIAVDEAGQRRGTRPDFLHLGSLPSRANFNVSGQPGVVLGVNTRSRVFARKSYPSLISPELTDPVYRQMGIRLDPDAFVGDRGRFIVLPPGEAAVLANRDRRAKGTSGSALLVKMPDARGVDFGGIIVAVVEITIGRHNYSLAWVLDHTVVRENIKQLFDGTALDVPPVHSARPGRPRRY